MVLNTCPFFVREALGLSFTSDFCHMFYPDTPFAFCQKLVKISSLLRRYPSLKVFGRVFLFRQACFLRTRFIISIWVFYFTVW